MLYESIRLALRTIARNTLRSFLTVLGIVIGVAAVIAMMTIGSGSAQQVSQEVGSLGSNLLMVRKGGVGFGPGSRESAAAAAEFSIRDADAIESEIAAVEAAAPVSTGAMTAIYGNQNRSTTVNGVDNRYLLARGLDIVSGRDFTDNEVRAGVAACILGETVRKDLFGAADPVGEKIRLKQISCRVVGLLEPKGASSFGPDQDDVVLLPLRTYQRRIAGDTDVGSIFVSARAGVSVDKVKADIEALLRERRRVGVDETDDFSVNDMAEISSMLGSVNTMLTGLLSSVAAISLLVGGIGIMNIMLVSVTERTREIGIRLAIGATERQVLLQFLIEAVTLSLIGGLIGVLLGLGLGAVGSAALSVPFSPDIEVTLLAFLFSAAVGVVFGYFPARRAARMDPIEALRHQ
jgi:putative ABC transport system permease protein